MIGGGCHVFEDTITLGDAGRNETDRGGFAGKERSVSVDRGQLFEKWKEEEFADLYSSEGKPGLSPVILAFVSVFQFMERLADRQAAQALRIWHQRLL